MNEVLQCVTMCSVVSMLCITTMFALNRAIQAVAIICGTIHANRAEDRAPEAEVPAPAAEDDESARVRF
jgi:hypothetical protein